MNSVVQGQVEVVANAIVAVATPSDVSVVAAMPAERSAPAAAVPSVINRVFLHGFLTKQCGKFVTVDFVKLDGSPRRLNGRLGVKAPLKGGSNTVMAADRPYLTVYDMKQKGYRTVNLASVSKVRAEGKEFAVV